MEKRLIELDIFRGLAVVIMIIVDAPPDFEVIYPILTHSTWQGITIADMAFPLFVFAMGMSASLSLFKKNLQFKKILKRVAILFGLGILFNAFPYLLNWLLNDITKSELYEQVILNGRILGVLQRLALTYLIGLVLCRILQTKIKIICAAILIMILTSAGFHLYNPAAPFDELDNLNRAIDIAVLGESHIYQLKFDPEGLYGTINSVATMMFGVVCLKLSSKICNMFGFGVILLILGLMWGQFDIISKPLWTAPFVLLTSGISYIIMSILTWLFRNFDDIKILQPLRAIGMNPIFFYLVTNIALIFLWTEQVDGVPLYRLIWQHTTKDFISPAFGAAIFTFIWCALWLPLAEFFYRKNIIIKI